MGWSVEKALETPVKDCIECEVVMPDGMRFPNLKAAVNYYGVCCYETARKLSRELAKEHGYSDSKAASEALYICIQKAKNRKERHVRYCPVSGYDIMYADLKAANKSLCIVGPDGNKYHSLEKLANTYGVSASTVRYWMRTKGISLNDAVLAVADKKKSKEAA